MTKLERMERERDELLGKASLSAADRKRLARLKESIRVAYLALPPTHSETAWLHHYGVELRRLVVARDAAQEALRVAENAILKHARKLLRHTSKPASGEVLYLNPATEQKARRTKMLKR